MKRVVLLICCGFLFGFALHTPLAAQPGAKRFFSLSQFPMETSSCFGILEDSLGFMWFATDNGLYRFDGQGMVNFRNILQDSTSLSNDFIEDLVSPDGLNFWVATEDGLNYYDRSEQEFQRFFPSGDSANGLKDAQLKELCIGPEGRLWLGFRGAGVQSLDPETGMFEDLPLLPPDAAENARISELFCDREGRIWIGTEKNGLFVRNRDGRLRQFSTVDTLADGSAISSNTIRGMSQDEQGRILIGTSGGGLNIYDPARDSFFAYRHDPDDPSTPTSDEAFSVLCDRQGGIWMGTWSKGLNWMRGDGKWQRMTTQKGMAYTFPGDIVLAIYEDSKGIIWMGTQYNGLVWYDPRQDNFNWYQANPNTPNSLSKNNILDILELSEDSLLIGTYAGGLNLYIRSTGQYTLMKNDPDDPTTLPNDGIWALHQDQKGRVWVGTSRGLSLFDRRQLNFKNYKKEADNPKGLSNQNVLCISEDARGHLWLGTWGGGMNVFDPATEEFRRYQHDPEDPGTVLSDAVKVIRHDHLGRVWAGTTQGLCMLDPATGKFTGFDDLIGEEDNPFSDNINAMMEVRPGVMVVGTNTGLFRIKGNRFDRIQNDFENSRFIVSVLLLDLEGNLWIGNSDGLYKMDPDTDAMEAFHEGDGIPRAEFKLWADHVGKSGRVYMGTPQGLLEFHPKDIARQAVQPRVVLTGFYLTNKEIFPGNSPVLTENISLSSSVTLSHNDYLFSLQFSALDFQFGDRIQYRYRLTDFDQDWLQTDQNNRRVTYTNVPPGDYTFEVQCSVDQGPWLPGGVSLKVKVLPPWWETWWARTLFIISLALLVGAGFRYRVRSLRRQKAQLEEEVRLRTTEIREQNERLREQTEIITQEKAVSEELLLNILPRKVAEELKVNHKATPRLHKSVSVLFLDFVGFTNIATQLTARELVEQLDMFFGEFDRIVTRHGLEKIKTIGDAYMCAGGIPEPQEGHCFASVQAGLDMLAFIAAANERQAGTGMPVWQARVGIHTGEVVAGVVGERKFAYDIWGDTVNTASRIQSNGQEGQVNVSAPIYEEIKDRVECSYRGQVFAKNKGMVDLYTVEAHSQA